MSCDEMHRNPKSKKRRTDGEEQNTPVSEVDMAAALVGRGPTEEQSNC